ncbi:hypothetical protein AKJ51_05010 [candidate division MSBL1 archaeon SCGC-AAA382A20]|uniref:Uncharacterized protein n=1 Tax=candidate division MSBL1 archaeon SCGC-AAA382A20 TaxID=1698280 RepID=A0A133VGB5_9EURY|nr:hypothetical protein AKJ51_05010 [candidate division MSBL1 archaeon SCGC-AAA382A20]
MLFIPPLILHSIVCKIYFFSIEYIALNTLWIMRVTLLSGEDGEVWNSLKRSEPEEVSKGKRRAKA